MEKLPDREIEMQAARPAGKISDVFDLLKRNEELPLSIAEMNEIAARSWAAKR